MQNVLDYSTAAAFTALSGDLSFNLAAGTYTASLLVTFSMNTATQCAIKFAQQPYQFPSLTVTVSPNY